MNRRKIIILLGDIIGLAIAFFIFIIPFWFMIVNALKERTEASQLSLALPAIPQWSNLMEVIETNDYQIITAFKNSTILTIGSVTLLVFGCSMAGYFIQRRKDKLSEIINGIIMVGLMIPPTILPTIWTMQTLGLYKTMHGMILLEMALHIPFSVMLYRGFVGSIPTELEESAIIDGCSRLGVFKDIIFPLLKPITATVIILNAVTIFNDFTYPLYFFPGKANMTVQVTLYSYVSQFSSSYNLLFADVLIITVPMLILFLFFNNRIVDGMVAGSVKG